MSEYERQYEDGSDPQVLDVLDIHLLDPRPHDYQRENWLLDSEYYWEHQGRIDWAERAAGGSRRRAVAERLQHVQRAKRHRTLLVARVLDGQGVRVEHILGDGSLESHEGTMSRLLELNGSPQEELFRPREVVLTEALARQEERIAYVNEKLVPGAAGELR